MGQNRTERERERESVRLEENKKKVSLSLSLSPSFDWERREEGQNSPNKKNFSFRCQLCVCGIFAAMNERSGDGRRRRRRRSQQSKQTFTNIASFSPSLPFL